MPTVLADEDALTRAIIADLVDRIDLVSEDDIEHAVAMLVNIEKTIVEGAGAAGLAAILAQPERFRGRRIGTTLCGGNIDPMVMERVISRGLAASARYLRVNIPLPDRPGQLAIISRLIADANANVVEVLHTRHGIGLQISEVILQLSVETRGEEHRAHVIAVLDEAGYTPTVVPD